jgi:hypothetical protein
MTPTVGAPLKSLTHSHIVLVSTMTKKRVSGFIERHPVIFFSVLTFFVIMLWGGVEEYSRACKKEWGSKWENNTKITVYEFNGMFCAFIRWIEPVIIVTSAISKIASSDPSPWKWRSWH